MLRPTTTVVLAMLALLCAAAPVVAQTDLDQRIDATIDAGLKWTWAQQKPSGLFSNLDPANVPETNRFPGDRTVMAMVSLAYAVGTAGYTYALRKERLGRPALLVYGIYLAEKLVGVYSSFDILFTQTGCKAYNLRGYDICVSPANHVCRTE